MSGPISEPWDARDKVHWFGIDWGVANFDRQLIGCMDCGRWADTSDRAAMRVFKNHTCSPMPDYPGDDE